MMRKVTFSGFVIIFAAFSLLAAPLWGQQAPEGRHYLMAPPAAFDNGLMGFVNPANVAFVQAAELRYYWTPDSPRKDGAVFGAFHGLGLALGKMISPMGVLDTRAIWTGARSGMLGVGLGYKQRKGLPTDRRNTWIGGVILRPNPWVNAGATAELSTAKKLIHRSLELAFRPFGSDRATLAASYAIGENISWRSGQWYGALVLRPVPGLFLSIGMEEGGNYRVGLNVRIGKLGLTGVQRSDGSERIVGVRLARPQRHDLLTPLSEGSEVVKFELKGKVDYLKYAWFDRNTHKFLDLLQDLKLAGEDPRVGAVALNLSGALIPAEMIWELRHELQQLRLKGKKVAIYLDNGNMLNYWFASAADLIIMDPEGDLDLLGFVLGRTYLKHTLEKLGLGFQELRFFKYKSAAETFANDHLSDADREQLQAYVDDLYETVRDDICRGRGMQPARFDSLVDRGGAFLAEEALQQGLVDTLARWNKLNEILGKRFGRRFRVVTARTVQSRLADTRWGPCPRIAVVYALGPCDMDTGIRARYLEKVFDNLGRRNDVKAIVFRVDSPGGLVVPSDIVARAIQRCRQKKPVVVSQGGVAGSGGYWISAFGDSILASPVTITGSIGVIGGWLYDKGFGEKLGLTSDFVKRGEHADLMHGVVLPGLGASVPHRALTEEEFRKARDSILKMYDHFVRLVSEARSLPEDSVRVIGEGRIYSGLDGLKVGLVDRMGGLRDAIELARKLAGIPEGLRVQILEFPRSKGLIGMPSFPRSVLSRSPEEENLRWAVRAFLDHQLQPLAIIPPALFPL